MPAIPIAATVAGAVISGNAQKKAAKIAAGTGNGGVDIAAVQQQAREADLQRIKDTNAAEDPTMKGIRTSSDQALLNSVVGDPNATNANKILSSLFNENINLDPRDAAFQQKLKTEAQKQLDLGGSFSPEQQAELVRAGLEKSSAAGYGAESTTGKSQLGKLLASESDRMATERQARAKDLFGFATDLNNLRTSNLLNISGASTSTAAADQNRLLNLAGLVDSRKETVGLTGGDIANLAVGNQNSANQMAANRASIAAGNAQARATSTAGLISGLTSGIGQGINAWNNRAGFRTNPTKGTVNASGEYVLPTFYTK